ncbi:MAG: HAD family hydrolase [Calditrichaeota bacterium]|nr:MAG: HAD family hydrolase [Calditrichota bacterium]
MQRLSSSSFTRTPVTRQALTCRHILWDWNGTLLDDVWLCVEIINELLHKQHLPAVTRDQYRNLFDFPVRDYYQKLGFDFEQTPFEQIGTEFMDHYRRRWRECSLHSQAEEQLQRFFDAGMTQVILSAAQVSLLDECTRFYRIEKYFGAVLGLDHHYADGKVEIARNYMQDIEIDPQHIVFIGDTSHDALVAQEIGVNCILYVNGHHPAEKLTPWQWPIIHSLQELQQLISIHPYP